MDQHLQNVVQKLRREKCPPRTLKAVRQRISMESARHDAPIGLRKVLGAAVILACVAFAGLVLNPARKDFDSRQSTDLVATDTKQVLEETRLALASIGQVFLTASKSGETILWDQLLPPLRGGFQTVNNKLNPHP